MGALALELFNRSVREELFDDCVPDEHPVTIFVGGQPGAGKSKGMSRAVAMHPSNHVVPIIGDDFRQLHPDFRCAVNEEPLNMPHITAPLSGELVGMSVAWANEHNKSSLIEGTWRNPATVLDSAREAKRFGRETHAVLICISPRVSRISTLSRYFNVSDPRMARWTPPEAHEAALAGMPSTIQAVVDADVFDRLSVMTRYGDVLYDGSDAKEWRQTFLGHWFDFSEREAAFVRDAARVVREGILEKTPENLWLMDYALSESNEPLDVDAFKPSQTDAEGPHVSTSVAASGAGLAVQLALTKGLELPSEDMSHDELRKAALEEKFEESKARS